MALLVAGWVIALAFAGYDALTLRIENADLRSDLEKSRAIVRACTGMNGGDLVLPNGRVVRCRTFEQYRAGDPS